ncbi:MAG: CvpA family protein [Verrucomicrobiales bacterium]|nr:CvpA family protein [Verrucomicrobiales bacterium]
MLIWLLALLLFALTVTLGYYQGAVRLLVSLVGLFVAALLAFPLVPATQFIAPLVGVKGTFWSWALPPLINFLVLYLIGIGVAEFVHRKVQLHYKYRADDVTRLRWERLNERLGACVGLVMGGVWLLLLGLGVYVAGYPTVQLSSDDNASGFYRFLNMARRDLRAAGLDKAVSRFDPTPAKFYEASDILGLVYNNPILISRVALYPPFLLTGDRPEFQEIANDKDFMSMLLSKSDIAQIINNPKTQTVINNREILQEMSQQDLKDLRTYLETGKSPKYDEEKILGRWQIDLYATLAQEKKKKPDMSVTEMRRLKKQAELMSNISFIATTDNKAILKVDLTEQQKQLLQAAQAPAAVVPVAAPTQPTMSPEMARRYGLNPGGDQRRLGPGQPVAAPPTPVPAKPNPNALTQPVFSAQGSWKREGDTYQISMQDEKGKQQSGAALAEEDKLTLNLPAMALVLVKAG